MKKLLVCAVALLAVSGIASANSVCVSTVMVVTNSPSLSFTCGDLTFSNFYVTNVSGNTGPLVIDARIKPHHAPPLEEDPEIARRVEALAVPGGPLYRIL